MDGRQKALLGNVLTAALTDDWPLYASALTQEEDRFIASLIPRQPHRLAETTQDVVSSAAFKSEHVILAAIGPNLPQFLGMTINQIIMHALQAGTWRFVIASMPDTVIQAITGRLERLPPIENSSREHPTALLLWIRPAEV